MVAHVGLFLQSRGCRTGTTVVGLQGHYHKPRSMAMPLTARTMRWLGGPLISNGPTEDCRRIQGFDFDLLGGSKRGGGGNHSRTVTR